MGIFVEKYIATITLINIATAADNQQAHSWPFRRLSNYVIIPILWVDTCCCKQNPVKQLLIARTNSYYCVRTSSFVIKQKYHQAQHSLRPIISQTHYERLIFVLPYILPPLLGDLTVLLKTTRKRLASSTTVKDWSISIWAWIQSLGSRASITFHLQRHVHMWWWRVIVLIDGKWRTTKWGEGLFGHCLFGKLWWAVYYITLHFSKWSCFCFCS